MSSGIRSIGNFENNKITYSGGMLFKTGASRNVFISSCGGAVFPSSCFSNIFINSSGNNFAG